MFDKITKFYNKKGESVLFWAIAVSIGYAGYRYYGEYSQVAGELFSYFIISGIIYLTNDWTKQCASTTKSSGPVFYAKALGWCLIIALVAKYQLGSDYENVDPMFGGGEKVTDYIPTHLERAKAFWRVFLVLGLSVTNGAMKGLPDKRFRLIRDRMEKDQKELP